MHWIEIGRFLIVAGITLVAIGFLFLLADKLPLGKLPGDLQIGKENFRFYIPVTTCILISVVITLVVNFFSSKK